MRSGKFLFILYVIGFALFDFFVHCDSNWAVQHYNFVVKEASYRRLCTTKKILTVNGQFPGPTLRVYKGDTIVVNVYNQGKDNITLHWHGVKQLRNPWPDGPEYITQCPIQPGNSFSQKVIFSTEEGTIWWHAHSDWSRATVHGAIYVYPQTGTSYPFPKPHQEVPIILGEWWKKDVREVLEDFIETGGLPSVSDAYTINGQPGDLYHCSKNETFKFTVEQGKTYLLRMVNAAMNNILFIAIANHTLTAVAADGSYTKPLTKEYMVISPGQTLDCLLHANQQPRQYYLAAKAYSSGVNVTFDNTTTTAIFQYNDNDSPHLRPLLPQLPLSNDTNAAFDVLGEFRSLASEDHPMAHYPSNISTKLLFTVSVNTKPCPKDQCEGPNGTRFAASVNNISFVNPSIDILQAYYKHIKGVFGQNFPSFPPLIFNYTADYQPLALEFPRNGTEVKILEYKSEVELVFQGTSLVAALDHPMHLHGYSFYVVGWGFGNFDKKKDPLKYNLVDPPMRNTIVVPINGWAAVRFKADNPGVWFMHCHLERHLTWGMEMAFIVKDGKGAEASILPPPPDMPPC